MPVELLHVDARDLFENLVYKFSYGTFIFDTGIDCFTSAQECIKRTIVNIFKDMVFATICGIQFIWAICILNSICAK